jgi:hypothetical protein
MSITTPKRRKPANPALEASAATPVHTTYPQKLDRMTGEVHAEFEAIHLELELLKSLLRLSLAVTESQKRRPQLDPGADLESNYWIG